MENEKFQELVIGKFEVMDEKFNNIDEKFDKIDEKFNNIDKKFDKIDEKFDSIDIRFDKLDRRIDDLDNRQCNLECDFKVMLKMMEKFNEKLDSFGQNQKRLERIVLRMENDSAAKVRAVFEKSDVHDYRLNDYELRIKTLEEKIEE